MYNFDALIKALGNLNGYVESTVYGDAAMADVVAAVAHARVDAMDDDEAVSLLSDKLFVSELEVMGLKADLEAKEVQFSAAVKSMTGILKMWAEALAQAVSEKCDAEKRVAELEAKNAELVAAGLLAVIGLEMAADEIERLQAAL